MVVVYVLINNNSSTQMIKLSILTFIFSLNLLVSQEYNLSNWKSYSSHISIRDAVVDKDSNIWCATSGGIFKYYIKLLR